jgi:hypothetical protein
VGRAETGAEAPIEAVFFASRKTPIAAAALQKWLHPEFNRVCEFPPSLKRGIWSAACHERLVP